MGAPPVPTLIPPNSSPEGSADPVLQQLVKTAEAKMPIWEGPGPDGWMMSVQGVSGDFTCIALGAHVLSRIFYIETSCSVY